MSYEHLWGVMGGATHAGAELAAPTGLEIPSTGLEVAPSRPHLSLVPEPEEYDEFDPFDPETATNEQWQERALCSQTDPEAFFPEKGGSTREAKKICQRCSVRSECLEYALAHDERFGIWGGLSERERRRLKRGII
ncbi:WhiB [Mycolicibacter minnesotensis]|uniref:Transcriptional regulator WhiB n=1 Tax=Mycolicibacter minnesotensis TaxID=1118379 RepID=A0A7I7R1Y9_9MYCO|nr:WhiB family transcriptional regulator [Mycolicibacter minnesotensis]ORB02641.1 WhiB [Mycolicibacter minnesotensis]BBY32679.1 transcriptional regulator WhiB [Mycolicibacter minnesotensis]